MSWHSSTASYMRLYASSFCWLVCIFIEKRNFHLKCWQAESEYKTGLQYWETNAKAHEGKTKRHSMTIQTQQQIGHQRKMRSLTTKLYTNCTTHGLVVHLRWCFEIAEANGTGRHGGSTVPLTRWSPHQCSPAGSINHPVRRALH